MKTIILCLSIALASGAFAQDALAELLGSQYKIASSIDDWANSGDYHEIYGNFSEGFQRIVSEENFREICEKGSWAVQDLRIGTVNEKGDWAYAAITARSIYNQSEKIIFDTLFFMKEDGEWRLVNFPFLPAEIPSLPRATELRYK